VLLPDTRSMADALTVAVVVPSYGRANVLPACLAGICAQTSPPTEIIVVVRHDDVATKTAVAEWTAISPLRVIEVRTPGLTAALNAGLAAATSNIVAFIDDDAVPRANWLELLLAPYVCSRVAAVGGRDILLAEATPSRPLSRGVFCRSTAVRVGHLHWTGRISGDHHVGFGPARDVDVLKGVNMSVRRSASAHGFDLRVRGAGTQMNTEIAFCLPLVRAGWRVVYDPAIIVDHFPADRPDRRHPTSKQRSDATHNETLAVLDYLSIPRRLTYVAWSVLVGTSASPGAVQLVRLMLKGSGVDSFATTADSLRGRGRGVWTHLFHSRGSEGRPPPPERGVDRNC